MILPLVSRPDRSRIRRDAIRRGRRLAWEPLEPRIALATVAEVEPNTLSEGRRGYYQNLFGSESAEVSARLASEGDIDQYQINVVAGAEVRIHFETEAGLSLSYSVFGEPTTGISPGDGDEPSWGTLPRDATKFQFSGSGQATAQPLPDASFVATRTGKLVLSVQGGSRGTAQGIPYGNVVGSYSLKITGLDPHGDAVVVARATSPRRVEASWSNSTPRKLSIEVFYARGKTLDTIAGKSFYGKKKLTIPITTKRPAPFEFGGGGIPLPRKRPAGVTHVLIVVNRRHTVPEGDFTNNVVALPLF